MRHENSELFAVIIWLSVLGILSYQGFKYADQASQTIRINIKTVDDMVNGNP